MAMARDSVGVAARSTVSAEAKLALLEDLQRCADPVSAAQSAAEWLLAHSGAERTIFAAPDHIRGMLAGIAGAGVSQRQVKKLALPLDDSYHPLVSALTNGSTVSFHSPRDSRLGVFGDSPFTSVKIGGTGDAPALGLMLISPATGMSAASVKWVADTLGRRLEAVGGPAGEFSDEGPRVRREHALLFSIINAATDPILFTNMEGQLIIANARAEMLFTAPDDVSEGRRRAVQLNNMFFSAALSHCVGEGEAGRAESCCLGSIQPKGPTCSSSCSARSSAIRAKARALYRFCATSPTCAWRRGRSTRTHASCARPRRKCVPSAPAEPAHRLGRRSDYRHGSEGGSR